jgi:hypothetical protein
LRNFQIITIRIKVAMTELEIETEHLDYDISTKGFIEDIEEAEEANTKRIENKELKDEHIQWLEEHLALLSEEFSRRTGLPLPSEG